ncbi:hypothetical protein M0R45_026388 [Rubus argutus]|uniref:Peroxidase n=1 Tax=Rubus argutus TaxID=59490 RepID=A0AAW1WYQ2_RUBAR
MHQRSSFILLVVLFALATTLPSLVQSQSTRVGFYSSSCPRAEAIVKQTVQKHFTSTPSIAPGLLRMHFHDCFVQGCDASVLLDGPNTEKTAGPNRGLRDILALAARDSVILTKGINWKVPTGRLDGRVSLASETSNLPGFTDSIEVQKTKFQAFGLNTQDLVTLVGGHTIGTSACQFFRYRLYNFTTIGNGADPTINPSLFLNYEHFAHKMVMQPSVSTWTQLWTDASTKSIVQSFLGVRGLRPMNFNVEFGRSMVKMSTIGVKSADKGEIRRICSAINN